MESAELLEAVKHASGAVELYHVTTLKGYRENKLGQTLELTIEVKYSGRGYTIVARDEANREATSNEYDSVQSAILGTHWDRLDTRDR
ncbi:MAG TPA: hypothetical protein VN965_07565 [Candidatus Dormibacteraeota bacterium]|nr:hypothetical protein [Candidatus Dormibacteraeota bacterium]